MHPDDPTVRGWRAFVHRDLEDHGAALRDADIAKKMMPQWSDIYLLRATVYRRLGKPESAFSEARALVAAQPDNSHAHATAAYIYSHNGRQEDAMREISRAIEIEPAANLYLERMEIRLHADITGRIADADAALRLDPKNLEAAFEKALLQRRAGNLGAMTTTLTTALRALPANVALLSLRGQAHFLNGRRQESDRDFAAARAAAKDGNDRNTICWSMAIADIDLTAALKDCDAAIAQTPEEYAPRDTRAFVLLKLGRLDEAIAGFDDALAIQPTLADSLLGRAIAWSRKGDRQKAAADRAAAVANDADIIETYRDQGISFD